MVDLNQSDTLEIGIEAHRKGRLEVSHQNFLAILRVAPNHPDASHNMGLLRVALGKPKEAIPFFTKAIIANPSISRYWVSYIGTLIKLRHLHRARNASTLPAPTA